MKKMYTSLMVLAAAMLFTIGLDAQTLPCGSGQVFDACACLSGQGTLIADAAPCDFSTADNQGYVLVDVVNSTVETDADDNSVVQFNATGTFSGVSAGDYQFYYITYAADDAGVVETFLEVGDNIDGLLSLATESGGTWTSTSPSFTVTTSQLATVNSPSCTCEQLTPCTGIGCTLAGHQGSAVFDGFVITGAEVESYVVNLVSNIDGSVLAVLDETTPLPASYDFPDGTARFVLETIAMVGGCVYNEGDEIPDGWVVETANFLGEACEDLSAIAEAICSTNSYTIVVALDGASSYNVSSPTGFNGTVSASFTDGPFPLGTNFSYTVTSGDNANCVITTGGSNVTCVTTAIRLEQFSGVVVAEGNDLFWITASETETDFFTLERSATGTDWAAIGQVAAAGNSNVRRSYSFLDANPVAGVNYYRLAETTRDGKSSIVSEVVALEAELELGIQNIFPVPAVEFISFDVTTTSSSVFVELFDVTGKRMTAFNNDTVEGANNVTVDVKSLPIGTYYITVTAGESVVTERFVKAQ